MRYSVCFLKVYIWNVKGGHGVKNQLIFRSRKVKITHTKKKLENFMFFEVTDFASEGLKVLLEL